LSNLIYPINVESKIINYIQINPIIKIIVPLYFNEYCQIVKNDLLKNSISKL